MKLPSLFRSAGLVLLFAAAGAVVSAQQTVKCESNNGGRNYCGSFPPDRVTMNQQISGSPCIRGNSWGVDNRGLWVDRGCRAIFMIGRGGGYHGGGNSGGYGGTTVKCESNNGGRNYCGSYGGNEVTLNQQISGSPCVRGSTWGVDGRGLWVDRGCRATFNVSQRGGGYHDGGYGGGGSPGGGTIKCESNNGGRNYCGNYPPDRVTLNQQISDSPCVRGRSWGVDNRGLWVDRGCRATFRIGR